MKAPRPKWLSRRARGGKPMPSLTVGLIALAVTALVAVVLYFKPTVATYLASGGSLQAEFKENYLGKLFPGETSVKLSGIESGTVSDVEYTDRGTTLVTMNVDDGILEKIRSKPTAAITPRTLLGGLYSIELRPGGPEGDFPDGDLIPLKRTSLPSGLDRITEALPRPTRQAVQDVVKNADAALAAGSKEELGKLLDTAPDTLAPAGKVLRAARGTRPGVDLPQLVTNLESASQAINRREGQLDSVLDNLDRTTGVLAAQSRPLADTISDLPATLRETRGGVTKLGGSLDRLTTTAESFRPAAQELDPLLAELDPVLTEARPLVEQLRPLLADARPAVDQLVPVSEKATSVVDDLRGPVLQRVKGPVLDTVMNTYRGTGPFEGSGDGFQADHKFYEELGYLVTNLDRGSKTQDPQGSLLSFQVGVGPLTSVAGLQNVSLPGLVEQLGRAAGVVPPAGPTGPTGPLPQLGELGRQGGSR